mmetsp:Transcript_30144/g.56031  ORF Transcript_30144/g.56031 Transcript_30144/m.56031 type:complete len:391 (-) Transcript_30144:240-1412(-)
MWSAIKSDLYEFVATVQEEAQESLAKVVDINAEKTSEEQEKISEEERILSEFRNNFSTYSEDVDPEQAPEFEKFLKSFALSSKAEEIEYILEEEAGVVKHYEALVPSQLTPDMFWARYFFKVNILVMSSLDSVFESAYEEEEELTWGEDDDGGVVNDNDIKENSATSTPHVSTGDLTSLSDEKLSHENSVPGDSQLQSSYDNLSTRATMLEAEVEKLQQQLIKERTVSAKLRNSLIQSEEREKSLTEEVRNLKQKLEFSENNWKKSKGASSQQEIEPSPLSGGSSGSSIVDLGHAHLNHPITPETNRDDDMGPSMSDLSLSSLQSVSSASANSTVSSPTESKVSTSVKKLTASDLTLPDASAQQEGTLKNSSTLECDEEEEEEWDNEAWE